MTRSSLEAHVQQLAPLPAELDRDWSAQQLGRITARPPSRRTRRRRRLTLASGTAAVVLAGGAAWGGGFVPAWVEHSFDDAVQMQRGPTPTLGAPRHIVDLRLSNGLRLSVWRAAQSTGGYCQVSTDYTGQGTLSTKSEGCTPSQDARRAVATEISPSFPISQDGPDPDTVAHVVYGDAAEPSAVSVRVSGPGVDARAPLDERTGGFALELPRTGHPMSDLRVEWLDETGEVVATEEVERR